MYLVLPGCITIIAQWRSLQIRLHSPGYFERDVEQKLLQVTCLRSHVTQATSPPQNITAFSLKCSKYYRNPRALLNRVGCILHKRCRRCIDHFVWHSPGGARVLHGTVVSFRIDIFIFVSMYRIAHKISWCTDISKYRFTPSHWH